MASAQDPRVSSNSLFHLVYFAPSNASFRSERRSVPAFHTLPPPTDIPEGATERPMFHTSNLSTFPGEPSALKSLRLTPLSTSAFASPDGSSRRGRRSPPLLDKHGQNSPIYQPPSSLVSLQLYISCYPRICCPPVRKFLRVITERPRLEQRNAAQTSQRDPPRRRKSSDLLPTLVHFTYFAPLRRIIPERATERPSVSHFAPSDGHSVGSDGTPCVSHLESSDVPQRSQWTKESPTYSSVYCGFRLSRRIISEETTDPTPR